MRRVTISVLLLLAAPAVLSARAETPTTAPDGCPPSVKARIGAIVADLFNQPPTQQQQARQQLETEPDLPAMLASLLADDDQAVRRNCLLLLHDDYGDWAVVAAVQTMLRNELDRGDKADGYVVAACCQILADWPQWDSIPVLINAIQTGAQVAGRRLPARLPSTTARPAKTAVWHDADAALRLVSGEWPLPEPDASADPAAAGSAQDKADNQQLQQSWGDWWANSSALADPLPQIRVQLTWTSPSGPADRPGAAAGQPANPVAAATSLLWIRPTGSVHYGRTLGTAPSPEEPAWKWDDRTRQQCEFHANAIQADAARSLASEAAAAPSATTWGIARPPGVAGNWHGRLEIVSGYGIVATVDLADPAAPGAVRPSPEAVEAISELLNIPGLP